VAADMTLPYLWPGQNAFNLIALAVTKLGRQQKKKIYIYALQCQYDSLQARPRYIDERDSDRVRER